MAKIKQTAALQSIGVLQHKTDPDRFALKFGTDIYNCNAETMLMLAASILKTLKASGHSTDVDSIALDKIANETAVPIPLPSAKDNN